MQQSGFSIVVQIALVCLSVRLPVVTSSNCSSAGPQSCSFTGLDKQPPDLCGWSKLGDMEHSSLKEHGSEHDYILGPKNANNSGRLESVHTCSAEMENHCLSLTYWIASGDGNANANLTVYLDQVSPPTWLLLWSNTSASTGWQNATVDFQTSSPFKVVIEAARSRNAFTKTVYIDAVGYQKDPCLESHKTPSDFVGATTTLADIAQISSQSSNNYRATRQMCSIVAAAVSVFIMSY